jgi:hypothetical protein
VSSSDGITIAVIVRFDDDHWVGYPADNWAKIRDRDADADIELLAGYVRDCVRDPRQIAMALSNAEMAVRLSHWQPVESLALPAFLISESCCPSGKSQ